MQERPHAHITESHHERVGAIIRGVIVASPMYVSSMLLVEFFTSLNNEVNIIRRQFLPPPGALTAGAAPSVGSFNISINRC